VKFAAFAFGVLATAFAFALDHYLGPIRQPFMALWPQSSGQQFLALGIWLLIAGAGLVGGMLTLLSPLSGGLLLLAAACGWFGIGASVPDGFSATVVVPLALCLMGSLVGIVAAGRPSPTAYETEDLPDFEDMARQEALTRDLELKFDAVDDEVDRVPPAPEVSVEEPVADLPVQPAPESQPLIPFGRQPRLLLVLAIANLIGLVLLSLVLLLLYLELRRHGLGP
jgi:hypothetical protein